VEENQGNAFANTNLVTVVFAPNLRSIELPDSVMEIEKDAFDKNPIVISQLCFDDFWNLQRVLSQLLVISHIF